MLTRHLTRLQKRFAHPGGRCVQARCVGVWRFDIGSPLERYSIRDGGASKFRQAGRESETL